MPLRVIQHYSDWVCTAVMSNDVMKDLLVFVILNTMVHCVWVGDEDTRLDETVLKTRRIFFLMSVFFDDHSLVLILVTVFTWSAIKRSQILVVNTIFVFLDIFYRVLLQKLHKQRAPFIPYPLNFLFTVTSLHHCYTLGRQVFPQN